jgi:hypothetical protein
LVDTSGAWLRKLLDDDAPKVEVWAKGIIFTNTAPHRKRVVGEENFEFL